jgi:two-component system, cell cycle sensor histidine kinase and response regulator CckA
LNNALTPITIAANLLNRGDLSEQQKPAVTVIEQAATRAKDMIAQVLSFAEVGRTPRGPVDITELVDEIRTFSAGVMNADIHCEIAVADTLPLVNGVASELYQVMTNLLINARDAVAARTDDGIREVLLSISAGPPMEHPSPWPRSVPDRVVRITVADTGVGMSPAVEERIFEPFFTTKGPNHGTGLGLASAQRIVRWSGGRLLTQTEQGKGTTFTVELPASPRSTAATEPPRSVARNFPARSRRILLLDDEFAVLWTVEALLEEAGYVVSTAETTAGAIDQIERAPAFDAVITDVNLAGDSGLELVRYLSQRGGDTPILVMTGSGRSNPVPEPLVTHVSAVLRKPFQPDALLTALADALGAPQETHL